MASYSTQRDVVEEAAVDVAYTASLAGAYDDPEDPSAPWVALPRVRCVRLTRKAGGVDEAQLYERFSELGQAGADGQVSTALPVDLEGKFVRVRVHLTEADGGGAPDDPEDPPKPLVWYGYVPQGSRNRVPHRTLDGETPVSKLSGVQQWRAVGMAWFLGRRQVDSAVVADRSPGAEPGAVRRVYRPLTFNGGDATDSVDRNRPRGNKSILTLSFTSPESTTDRPRAIAAVAAAFDEAQSTISLVAKDGAPAEAELLAETAPEDYAGATPTVPSTIDQAATRVRGVVGDLLRLAVNLEGTLWEIDAAGSVEWTAETMVEYLLEHHGPVDEGGDPAPCVYELGEGGDALRTLKPNVPTEGRDVLSLLGVIVARSRGVEWSCEVVTPDEDDTLEAPVARVHAFSLAGEAIALPGGAAFPANPNQHSVDSDDDPFRGLTVLSVNREQRYHRVTARGARTTSTFTLAVADGTLLPDWTIDAENDYRRGASEEEDYPTAEDERRRANDARRYEPRVARVFSAFRVPPDWDGKTADGDAASTRFDTFPLLGRDGVAEGSLNPYLPGLRPLRRTRLPAEAQGGAGDEFELPFAVVQDAGGAWAYAHSLTDAAADSDERLASYRLARAEGGIGLRLHSSKQLSHTLAAGFWPTDAATQYVEGRAYPKGHRLVYDNGAGEHFWRAKAAIAAAAATFNAAEWDDLGAAVTPAPSRVAGEVDYRTLRVTITAEGDGFAEASFGASPDPGIMEETLVIDAGDSYRLDFLAVDTVKRVEKGALVTALFSDRLRDDRPDLEKIAAMAYAWYRHPTRSVRLHLARAWGVLRLGDYLTAVGRSGQSDPVGTVVTEIDLALGDRQETTIGTSGVEQGGVGAVAPREEPAPGATGFTPADLRRQVGSTTGRSG